jgi:mannosyltransferase
MIIVIIAVGFLLRLINLNQSLWLDEAVQAITSRGTFLNIFQELHGDFHPPLYHVFMWFWVHLFGNSEIILRLPSVIFGTLTIYVVYRIAKEKWGNEKFQIAGCRLQVAEMVMLFMATAPFHIYYSQEARPYAFVALLTSCSMLFLMQKKWRQYLFFTVLALYSSYFVLFILLAQSIYLLLQKEFKNLQFVFLSLIIFMPGIPLLLTQLQTGKEAMNFIPEWGQLVNLSFYKALPLTFLKFSIGRITIFNKVIYGLLAVFLIGFNGLFLLKGTLQKDNRLWTLWFLFPLLTAWFVSFFVPNFQPFRLLFILPVFYLLIVSGIIQLPKKLATFSILIILIVNISSIYWFNSHPYFYREDWRSLVFYLESQNQAIVIIPSQTSDWPWNYYSKGKSLIGISNGAKKVMQSDFTKTDLTSVPKIIYYIRYLQPVFDPNEEILNWLNKTGYNKVKEITFNQLLVWEYEK